MDHEDIKINKKEPVVIPYDLFEKMLNNQVEVTKKFCRIITFMFITLILPILAWAIGYFIIL